MDPPERRSTRSVTVGGIAIGGGSPITVQSMTTTDLRDPNGTLHEIERLADAGCEIVRVAFERHDDAGALAEVAKGSRLPVVADVHFDWRLAFEALEAGVHKLRVNPGNMDCTSSEIAEIAREAASRAVPVRVGVNSGSVRPRGKEAGSDLRPLLDALVETALEGCRMLEDGGLSDIVVSMKAADVATTVAAYRTVAAETDYPLHVGVTAAGPPGAAAAKSAIGIGALLLDGIGDTLRVSYTGDPVEEVRAGYAILEALEIRRRSPQIISCPTCGRCKVDLFSMVEEVRRRIESYPPGITVAVMGCVVNGPGEAAEADVGLAAGPGTAVIFRAGERVRRVGEAEAVDALIKEIDRIIAEEPPGAEGGER